MKHASILMGAVMVTGCASLGRFSGEPFEAFPVAPDAPANWAAAGIAGEAERGDWLRQFNDPVLERLVGEALTANPTLEARLAARDAAVFDAIAERGNLRPFITGSARTGGSRTVFEGNDGDAVTSDSAIYGLGLNASWEADLWGRLRAGVDLAETDLAIAEADLASAELSVAAQTAIAWVELNAALAQRQVAAATVEARDRTRELTERRLARGVASALDVRLARSALAQSEADLAFREQTVGEAARRLEVLLGRYPSAEIEAPALLPQLDPIVPVGNPVLLLSRRPDIASAEAQVIAAGLRAEQARLALLPSLDITGSLSTSEDNIENAFDPSFIAGQLIASLSQPLYAGGQLRARRDAFIERARIAVANYADQALTAWQEVEDALAADTFLTAQEAALTRALEEAAFAEDIAERQYQNGLIVIFNLIDAQTRRLNAESSLVTARTQRATNRIRYYLALGGGPTLSSASPDLDAGPAGGSPDQ